MLEPGLFMIFGLTLPGIVPEVLCERIDGIIEGIIHEGISGEQLDKARHSIAG